MRASDTNINKSIQEITVFLVKKFSQAYKCSEEIALQRIMKTLTYELLNKKSSKLYAESPEYVLDMLISELSDNVENWLNL